MRLTDLSEEEKQNSEKLHKTGDKAVTKERCLCLLLSSERHSVKEISRMTGVDRLRIVRLFNHRRQAENKYADPATAPGRGAETR